jgi:hypothetical protein
VAEAIRGRKPAFLAGLNGTAEQFAEKVDTATAALKGAIEVEQLTASLKRCPDTKREFFGMLSSRAFRKTDSWGQLLAIRVELRAKS